jgi:hypothetical protein
MSKKQKWERNSEEAPKEEVAGSEVPSLQELMDIVEEEKVEALQAREESVVQPESEEVIEADAAIPQAELEALLAKEFVIEKYSIGEVCARHVPGWKAQWLPGVTAHAKFHGVNENDTVENIKNSILSYGLLFR